MKKRQQAIVGFLESNRISFEEVDITMQEDQRLWMYQNIPEEKRPVKGNPLPPQIFSGDHYCGVSHQYFSLETNSYAWYVKHWTGDAPSPIKTCSLNLFNNLLSEANLLLYTCI